MSGTPVAVQSREGTWYEDPLIVGNGYYVCWPPGCRIELIVDRKASRSAEAIARELCADGWKVRLRGDGGPLTVRCFPNAEGRYLPDAPHDLRQVLSYWLDQKAAPPRKLLKHHKCIHDAADLPSSCAAPAWARTRYANAPIRSEENPSG